MPMNREPNAEIAGQQPCDCCGEEYLDRCKGCWKCRKHCACEEFRSLFNDFLADALDARDGL